MKIVLILILIVNFSSLIAEDTFKKDGVLKIILPPEPGGLREVAGVEIANGSCLICHSREYIENQPVLDKKYWEDTVDKMRKSYGAPMTDKQAKQIIDYLVKAYVESKQE
jgi:hypothetical protein